MQSQKLQSYFLNSVRTILKMTSNLLGLKNNKNLAPDEIRKNIYNLIHDCTDAIAILSHVNKTIEQNQQDNIGNCLYNQYHQSKRNVPPPPLLQSGFLETEYWTLVPIKSFEHLKTSFITKAQELQQFSLEIVIKQGSKTKFKVVNTMTDQTPTT